MTKQYQLNFQDVEDCTFHHYIVSLSEDEDPKHIGYGMERVLLYPARYVSYTPINPAKESLYD